MKVLKLLTATLITTAFLAGSATQLQADDAARTADANALYQAITGAELPEEALDFFNVTDPMTFVQVLLRKSVDLNKPAERDFFLYSYLPAVQAIDHIENFVTLSEAKQMGTYEQLLRTRDLAYDMIQGPGFDLCVLKIGLPDSGMDRNQVTGFDNLHAHNFGLSDQAGVKPVEINSSDSTVKFSAGNCMRNNDECCNKSGDALTADTCTTETRYCRLIRYNGIMKCNAASRDC